MKSYQKLLKKIFALSLAGCIVFSTIFFSYENAIIVEAADYEDLLRDAVYVGLAAFGVVTAVSGGATLTPALLLPFITNIAGTGFDIYDYVTDNGDGTTTISEEFIQIVGQAYQQYKEENADLFDGNLNMTQEGYYYFPSCEVTIYHPDFSATSGFAGTVRFTDIYSYFPCAIYLWHDDDHLLPVIIYYNFASDKFYSQFYNFLNDSDIEGPSSFSILNPKNCTKTYVDVSVAQSFFSSFSIGIIHRGLGKAGSITANSSSIPVYHNLNALKQGLKTEDFSAAFNYGTIPDMESSKYTGFYEGGDITVTNEKLAGISDKLDEINETGKDIDSKLQDLLDWLNIGDNNKPGDNTGDNSGILDGIADIFEGMTSAISGYLDAILMYLESILTDLDYIVLQMQDMTEEEVSTKSDSVITELSSAFSEIGDVMSQKFPFSIPWDIKNLYVALSGGKEPGIQSLSDDIGISDLYHDSSPPSLSGGKLIDVIVYSSPSLDSDGMTPLVADEDMGDITPVPPSGDASFTDSGAPVFKIPFVIRSAGVNAAVLIDMSYFDIVSEFSRTMFLLIFLHQLFLLSMRVFEFVKSFMG